MELQRLLRQQNSVLLLGNETWLPGVKALLLHSPCRVATVDHPSGVPDALKAAEHHLELGQFVILCLSYEASAVFGLSVHEPGGLAPAAWLAAYQPGNVIDVEQRDLWPFATDPNVEAADLRLNVTPEDYKTAVGAVKDLIARGDTYQVNYTCHARLSLAADSLGYFLALARSHPVPYAAFVNIEDQPILSLSPELLLQRRDSTLESRPMKGTRRRGCTIDEDRRLAQELVCSPKDRAENVMILDMMRNDLGKICRIGSVRVPEMFRAEKYRSVWQMTSAVTGEALPDLRLTDIFEAVFPGSSITGAPKKRTMEIIRDLEHEPRGLYTGTIGLFTPGGDFTCNLPIRTLVRHGETWDLGIGSGIVWDSDPQAEYEETLLKSQFALSMMPRMRLFETMLAEESGSVLFLEEHLERLAASAEYWDMAFDPERAREQLESFVESAGELPFVIRMELDQDGELTFVPRPAPAPPIAPVKVTLSERRTDSRDRFLFHKTSLRKLYQEEYESASELGFFETLFRNENDHVTEGAITNVFIRTGKRWFTPPITDGLLPGIWRRSYIAETGATERSITFDDLTSADEIVIGNSVRGAIRVEKLEIYQASENLKSEI